MNADEIIRRFAPELARSLHLDPVDSNWRGPVLGVVRAFGPGGPEDLLHKWPAVWMQGKRTRYGWDVRLLESLSWTPTKDIEVHGIELQHPDVPNFMLVPLSTGCYPIVAGRGDPLSLDPRLP